MKKILSLTFALALVAGSETAHAQRALRAFASIPPAIVALDAADSLYLAGRDAITAGNYRRAASLFKQVVDAYPKSDRVPDALYYRAWSLLRVGRDNRSRADLAEANDAVQLLIDKYAKNDKVASDAKSLRSDIRSAQAQFGSAEAATEIAVAADKVRQQTSCPSSGADEETREAALDGLLSMNSEDAVPILKDVLKQRDPCRVELRKKAVWMISQKRGVDVAATLLEVARTDPSSDVRGQAIFWLGSSNPATAVPALDSILFSAADDELRKNAIFSLAQTKDERGRQALRRAVEDERLSDDVRGDALFWLGNTGHTNADLDYFKALFKKTHSEDLRSRIVQAVSNTGTPEAGDWLLDVARDKSYNIETRKNAVFWASQRRTMNLETLGKLYDESKGDEEMHSHLLWIMSQRHEPAALDKLMDIARNDPNIETRKSALFWIGQKNDPRAKAFIRELINK